MKSVPIVYVRIRMILTEIQGHLWAPPTVTSPASLSLDWYQAVFDRLQQWRHNLPPGLPMARLEWLHFQYHWGMILLHRPAPRNKTPTKESLTFALRSSADVMRTYRELHRLGGIHHGELSCLFNIFLSVQYIRGALVGGIANADLALQTGSQCISCSLRV
jgi:hypothetical protein